MGKKKKEELPDYTVAKMDVDGMPWNSRRPWQILPGDPSKHRKEFDVKVPEPGMESDMPDNLSAFENPPMTKEERRGMIWLSLKASLTVGLIFGGAAFFPVSGAGINRSPHRDHPPYADPQNGGSEQLPEAA